MRISLRRGKTYGKLSRVRKKKVEEESESQALASFEWMVALSTRGKKDSYNEKDEGRSGQNEDRLCRGWYMTYGMYMLRRLDIGPKASTIACNLEPIKVLYTCEWLSTR